MITFKVTWIDFVHWVNRGRAHTSNLQKEKPIQWLEKKTTISFYYDFLGSMYETTLKKDTTNEEDLQHFFEVYLKGEQSVPVLSIK